jgi:LEA14-like dessication related protein
MGVRSTAGVLTALTAAGVLAACASTPEGPVAPEVRRAEVVKVEITEQSFTDFQGLIHVKLEAGQDQGLVLDAARWTLSIYGKQLADGRVELGQALPASGDVVKIPFLAPYAADDAGLAKVLEKPAALPGFFQGAIEASVGPRKFEYEYSHTAFVRSPRVPKLQMYHVEAAKFRDLKEINLVFFIDIQNPNPFDIRFEGIDYDLLVEEQAIVQKGLAGVNARVPAGTAARVEIPVTLSEENFQDVMRLIKQNTTAPYRITGDARLGLGHIPFELEGPIDLGAGTVKHAAD